MVIRLSMLLGALLLAGCSTFPDKIKVADTNALVSYEDASSQAEQVKGKMVRWGGAIAKVENKAESTVFEMVYYPLNGYGRPVSDDESMGRFRMTVNGFMDPMVYKVGRLMTFTGELGELQKGSVGEHAYVFPSAQVKGYYLWKNVQRIDVSAVSLWHQDYWHGYYPRPYHRRYFIRATNNTSRQDNGVTRPAGITTYPKPVSTQRAEKK
jgi:outer membrane lipoprotein